MDLTKAQKATIRDWQAKLPVSPQWTIDDVLFYNRGTELTYIKGRESGPYMQVTRGGKFTIGTYEIALPHISDGLFTPHLALDLNIKDAKELSFKIIKKGGKI